MNTETTQQYFLIFATDAAGKLELRQSLRPKHRAYLKNPGEHPVKVCLGGPTLTADASTMNGTLLAVAAQSINDVHAFLADDPYSQANLFDRVEIRPWSWSLGNPFNDAL